MNRPILFSTDMVRANLAGYKSQTRRLIKISPNAVIDNLARPEYFDTMANQMMRLVPKYQVGDVLWVRETWRAIDYQHIDGVWSATIDYKAGGNKAEFPRVFWRGDASIYDRTGWRPSIHMPKAAARLFYRVTGVRPERLQDSFFAPISPILAVQAEGIDIGDTCRECIDSYGNPCCVDSVDDDGLGRYGSDCGQLDDARGAFADLWDSLNAKRGFGWAVNPWVWVYTYEPTAKPEGWPG